MMEPVYQKLARAVDAYHRCVKTGNDHADIWEEVIEELAGDCLPRGGGFDSGTKVDLDKSTGERLVLSTSYHHMSEVGMYEGWSDCTIVVKPSLMFGYSLRITGCKRDDREYVYDVFGMALSEEVDDVAE